MIEIKVENEYSKLEKVVLGIADDFGPPPKINDCYDPKTRLNVINNSHPVENELTNKIGMRVFLNIKKRNAGILSFEYKEIDQLDRLISIIKDNY